MGECVCMCLYIQYTEGEKESRVDLLRSTKENVDSSRSGRCPSYFLEGHSGETLNEVTSLV